ncbi:hypothetical protein SAMN04488102_1017 [Alkalibacterium subtropicum]|uniref:Uncharacterized protein n=1 Tax=Alkalibacterium subtropicum TaxID=753702 RepID=A0A1I1E6L9_9LACT|nr:hypothetical protein SAMN04488102_1017 [Alkalibacterium subtropicum]
MTRYKTSTAFDKLYPLTSTSVGALFAYLQTNIVLLPFVVLLIYTSTQVWLKHSDDYHRSKKVTAVIILIHLVILLYLSISFSFFILPIFLILTFFIQTKTIFNSMKLQQLYTFLYSYVTVIIFNLLSYYLQVRYLSLSVTLSIASVITTVCLITAISKRYLKRKSNP